MDKQKEILAHRLATAARIKKAINVLQHSDFVRTAQQKSDFTDLPGSVGDAFTAPTPVPSQAIERAESLLGRPNKFTGEDRFAAAVASAMLFRASGRSELDAGRDLGRLNPDICAPPLDPSELRDATYVAYFEPEIADRIIVDALSGVTKDAPGSPGALIRAEAHLPAGRETFPTEFEKGIVDPPAPAEVGRQRRRPMSGAERMRRRRAELRRLGLPAETKGRLKSLKVTPPVTATAEIVTPTAGSVTAIAGIVTPDAMEVADVQ
jgi:hypothetical protein